MVLISKAEVPDTDLSKATLPQMTKRTHNGYEENVDKEMLRKA